jgi:hypothetical protein
MGDAANVTYAEAASSRSPCSSTKSGKSTSILATSSDVTSSTDRPLFFVCSEVIVMTTIHAYNFASIPACRRCTDTKVACHRNSQAADILTIQTRRQAGQGQTADEAVAEKWQRNQL